MTHDNGMDASPSWQELKERCERAELLAVRALDRAAVALAERDELKERCEALAAHVEGLKPALEDFARGMGVCCCGDYMDSHTINDGHSPVDSGWYALDQYMSQAPTTSLARLKDEKAAAIQKAVKQARREWAAQGSPAVKAQWQAEALSEMIAAIPFSEELARNMLKHRRDELRRQAEGGE